jgi:hypothetical protein
MKKLFVFLGVLGVLLLMLVTGTVLLFSFILTNFLKICVITGMALILIYFAYACVELMISMQKDND